MAGTYAKYSALSGTGGGGGGILSINSDITPAQVIAGGTGISVATVAGTTTITNTSVLATPVSIAHGGTGQTTQTTAFDALSPNTTAGDITVFDGTHNVRLAAGPANYAPTYTGSGTGITNKSNRLNVGSIGNTFLLDGGGLGATELTLAGLTHMVPNGGGGTTWSTGDFGSGGLFSFDSSGNVTIVGNLIYGGQRSSSIGTLSATTTDATVTTIYSRNASPWAHDSFTYNVEILSFDSTNDVYGFWCYKVRVQTAASTSTIVTTDAIGTNTTPAGYGGVTFSITSSTTFNVLVQGKAATTVTWRCFINQVASNGGQ